MRTGKSRNYTPFPNRPGVKAEAARCMFNRVNRRSFLKHGASSLLATSIWPALPIVSDATQGQGSQVRPTLGSQGGVPILAPPPINQFSKYELLERATYVSGRGEIENYFRNAAKPVGCEQNL